MKNVISLVACLVFTLVGHAASGAMLPLVVDLDVSGNAQSDSFVETPPVSEDDFGSDWLPAGSTGTMNAFASTDLTVQNGNVKAQGWARARIRISNTATSYIQVTNDGEARRIGTNAWHARNDLSCDGFGTFEVDGPGAPAFIHWSMRAIGQGGDQWTGGGATADINGWDAEIEVIGGLARLHWNGDLYDQGVDVYASGVQAIGHTWFGWMNGQANSGAESTKDNADHSTRYYLRINLRIEQ